MFQYGDNRDGFHDRPRFDHIGHRPVTHTIGIMPRVIGVVGWLVDHRQHFARIHVQHHYAAGACTVLQYRTFQFAVSQVLQALVYRQVKIITRVRFLYQLNFFNGLAFAVLDNTLTAGAACQPTVIGKFQTFLTDIVDIGETDYVGCHLACRVKTAVFFLQINAGNIQCTNLFGDIRVQASL